MNLKVFLEFLEVNSMKRKKGWDPLVKVILNQEVTVGGEHR